MKPTGHWPPGDARRRAVRHGHWRAVAAAPAMTGGLLVLILASGAFNRWAGLLPLAWAACAGAATTRVGERMTVRAVHGFLRPSPVQATALAPAWSTALRVTGTAADDVDLYVQNARALNAYAAGGRSVAVTSQVLEDYHSGRLPEDQLVAVLVHELGHHATGATRPMLLVSWLTAPWRWAARLLTGLASVLAGRQPEGGAMTSPGRRFGRRRDRDTASGAVDGWGSPGVRRAVDGALSFRRRRDQSASRDVRRPIHS